MNRLFNALAAWSVDHRWPILLLIVLLTTTAVVGWVDPELTRLSVVDFTDDEGDEDELEVVDDDDDEVDEEGEETAAGDEGDEEESGKKRRRRRRSSNGGGMFSADSILVVDSPDFFTPQGAAALRAVVDALENQDYIDNVMWMDEVPNLNIFGLAEPLFPRSEASERRFAAAREKALNNPLVAGQLLSGDGQTLLMMIRFDWDWVMDDAQVTEDIRTIAVAAAEPFSEVDLTFQVTGGVPMFIAAVSDHESNQLLFLSIGFGMVGLMAVILFRGFSTVLIVSVAPIVGVAWTLGIIQFIDYGENNGLINVVLPVMVAMVGITDGVHLMVQIRKLRAEGRSVGDAARIGLQQVGLACFLTSFTTAVGFGSLVLADSDFVQNFGRCAVVGVTMSFLAVVTIIPLLCSTRLGRDIHVGLENSLIDQNLGRISGLIDLVLLRRRGLSVAGIVLTAGLFVLCISQLEPDQRDRDHLPAGAEATLALDHIDQKLGGLESSRVEVQWPENLKPDDPRILEAVMAVDETLRQEPLIGHPLSIRNLIESQPGDGPPAERMSMLELLPPPIKDAFLDTESQTAIVLFRVQDLGIATYGPVFERVQTALAEFSQQHDGFHFQLKGDAVWRWENLFQVVVDLATSLGSASVIIFIVLAFVFRSVRIGLISMIPNTFPLVLAGAWLVVAGYNLEIVMVCCFTVCLGIAVDDTIHFLTRFHEELEHSTSIDEAIRRAFTGVGTALIMTTMVLVAGFSTVTLSGNREYYIFAVMGVITIGAALFADLVFLPPLLSRFARVPSAALHPAARPDGETAGESLVDAGTV